MKIRTLIVDDEPLARERLRALLQRDPEIEIAGECASGRSAVAAIKRYKPHLLFLDVQMPGLDGFGVLEAVGPERMPCTVFVTAYDQYALRAFEVSAVDYLLKPFDRERFEKALRRVKAWIRGERTGNLDRKLIALLEGLKPEPKYLERLVVKSGGRIIFLRSEEIDWIEAAGNYIRLHSGSEAHLLRETMGALEAQLDPDRFVRIHRSTIVNIERVKELQPWFRGDFVVILNSGVRLTLSRGCREKVEALLGRSL
jgi:two-component system, LytTR family, response regulator